MQDEVQILALSVEPAIGRRDSAGCVIPYNLMCVGPADQVRRCRQGKEVQEDDTFVFPVLIC